MNVYPYIEERAERLLKENNCLSIPIKVEKCAASLGITLKALDLDDDVAGFLLKKNNEAHIGYNKKNVSERVRFTIAHELGHFVLHEKDSDLFVDKEEEKILYRDHNSSKGQFIKEREANAFAAALLMPQNLLLSEIEKNKGEGKNKLMKTLARKFRVSEQAITIRLTNLGVIDYDLFAA